MRRETLHQYPSSSVVNFLFYLTEHKFTKIHQCAQAMPWGISSVERSITTRLTATQRSVPNFYSQQTAYLEINEDSSNIAQSLLASGQQKKVWQNNKVKLLIYRKPVCV